MTTVRASSEHGELMLRDRGDGAIELRVNGLFVMDTVETSSERELAAASLTCIPAPHRVLVAGLGLGFTLRAVLGHPQVRQVTVVELEPPLVDWMRRGLVPGGAALLADARVSVQVCDVAEAVAAGGEGAYDVMLLDVDNGPDFLVHEANAALYRAPFLRRCALLLGDRGVLVVWSMNESAALVSALQSGFPHVWTRRVPVRLGQRDEAYWLHLASSDPDPHADSWPLPSPS